MDVEKGNCKTPPGDEFQVSNSKRKSFCLMTTRSSDTVSSKMARSLLTIEGLYKLPGSLVPVIGRKHI